MTDDGPAGNLTRSGPLAAMVAAGLFGASTPLAKLLLGSEISPNLLAGLLYLGSGCGLSVVYFLRRAGGHTRDEAPLRRPDLPWLGLVVLFGGALGPVLLMIGLVTTPASTAALLLTLEGLATMAIAWIAFRESVDRRLLVGALAILAGSVVLSWPSSGEGVTMGALAIVGACLAWGIDNNLTRKLSAADPVQIAAVKGVGAGAVNLALALMLGDRLPSPGLIGAAALVGLFGCGISLVLFVVALRHLGAARTGAYFSTAPFIGALLSLEIFDEPVTTNLVIAGLMMGAGVALHLAESHRHRHRHDPLEHEHRHSHDEHHRHTHPADVLGREPHSHRHRHAPLAHEHPHFPDLHHRHAHAHDHDHSATKAY